MTDVWMDLTHWKVLQRKSKRILSVQFHTDSSSFFPVALVKIYIFKLFTLLKSAVSTRAAFITE